MITKTTVEDFDNEIKLIKLVSEKLEVLKESNI